MPPFFKLKKGFIARTKRGIFTARSADPESIASLSQGRHLSHPAELPCETTMLISTCSVFAIDCAPEGLDSTLAESGPHKTETDPGACCADQITRVWTFTKAFSS